MKNITYLLISVIVSFIGCSSTIKKEKDDNQQEKISITRFDKDVYNYLQSPNSEKETELKQKYPLLLPAFGRIAMDNSDPATFFPSLKEYFSHSMLMQIYKDALKTFNDVTLYEEELTSANVLISENFAGRKMPELAMHVSGFKENVIILNDLISISVDKYLGSDYNAYQNFFQPFEYQQMQPKYIVRDYLKAWLMSEVIKPTSEKEDLLSAMVTEGKILYALSYLLPKQGANDIIGYTDTQLTWCKENEKDTWQKIVKQNYLFSDDHMIITRLISDASQTSLISQNSPGRIGSWVGWQIVDKFAKKKNISLLEIINTDAQTILKDSKYNP